MDDPVTFARKLRRQQTPAERRFWALLHPWRSAGMHWRRQAPVGPYVVDFVCKAQKLTIQENAHCRDTWRHNASKLVQRFTPPTCSALLAQCAEHRTRIVDHLASLRL